MVNNATEVLIYATPAMASAAVAGAAWWTKPGRAALRAGKVAAMSVVRTAVAVGRFVRQLAMVVVVWVASLVPLYFYAFFALVMVLGYTQCGPGNPGCLFG
ncbi:MAG: hypothetical protein ACTHMY_00280 [Solirubrobacteraceae bacterium]